ncbi:hypothetical protein V6N11_070206 [Hibiscus sabdariffa]|uniref:F-box domain-containing protein n=1 Tax=Hibiscus sabdariffa TaxID=183260 RepID=A0ABR2QEC2_9ROSI
MPRRKRKRRAAAETHNLLEMPPEVKASVLSRLGAIDILNSAQKVCSQWRNICKDPSMWRSIDMRNSGEWEDGRVHDYQHSIERVPTAVAFRCSFYSLNDAFHRSVHLKHLRLFVCYDISEDTLGEVALKLPCLEELEVSICYIAEHSLKTIGRNCPLLKSLKYNHRHSEDYACDDHALAIAQSMPELCRLELLGNALTNEGLQAILDGCRHLEYLDLRQCFNVHLGEDLEKRCVERIKTLRRPDGSTHDYEFFVGDPDTLSYPFDRISDSDDDYDLFANGYDHYFKISGASESSDHDSSGISDTTSMNSGASDSDE